MRLNAYICPQCGGALNAYENTEITQCPHCKASIRISYEGEKVTKERSFITPEGQTAASAVIPADYELSAVISRTWQSEMVPCTACIDAVSSDHTVYMQSSSREIYHDIRNIFLTTIRTLVRNHTENGYQKFADPESFVRNFAEKTSGISLTHKSTGKLPSILSNHPENAQALLDRSIRQYGAFLEMTGQPVSRIAEPVLYKYTGTLNNHPVIILAGCDYEGAELVYGPAFLNDLSAKAGKAMENIRGAIEKSTGKELPSASEFRKTASAVFSGKEKMTAGDWMKGGLLGKMLRDRKEASVKEEPAPVREEPREEGPVPFGHAKEYGKRVDHVLYGAERTYYCMCFAEKEAEASAVFARFVSSIRPDPSLARYETDAIRGKLQAIREEASQNQALARQKQLELQRMQMETSRMISRNAAQASAGLMDSWKKKMDSDSRISESYSEAVRGVDSYQETDGSYAEVSTAADHVYQDAYGDVYGISGNAPDDDILNQLDWKEIPKK